MHCYFILAVTACITIKILAEKEKLNNRPIIAIICVGVPDDKYHSYVAASYVKFIESAGGRAALIPSTVTIPEVKKLFHRVNGVFFSGGGNRWFISSYHKHAKTFYDLAIKANDNGDYFPIWGSCLGMQVLHVLRTNSIEIISQAGASDVSLALNFTKYAPSSKLFKGMSKDLYHAFATQNFTYNHHKNGISPDVYDQYPELKSFYHILSTNRGPNGKEFISMFEAINYPFYGVQWHPEKTLFEFTMRQHIPHTKLAIRGSQYMANFLVNEARKNHHKFPSFKDEMKHLSYMFPITYVGDEAGRIGNFAQIYMFPDNPPLVEYDLENKEEQEEEEEKEETDDDKD